MRGRACGTLLLIAFVPVLPLAAIALLATARLDATTRLAQRSGGTQEVATMATLRAAIQLQAGLDSQGKIGGGVAIT